MSESRSGRRRPRRASVGPRRLGTAARLAHWPLRRMQLTGAVVILLFAGLAVRAWGLQIDRNQDFREAAERQHVSSVEVPAPRGVIRDAVGRELAVTADAPSLWANPAKVEDVTGTAERLSAILSMDQRVLEEKLSSDRRFTWLRRHVRDEVAQAVKDAKLPGVHVVYEPRRYYPGKSVAGPILGFANIDGVGIEGIELAMDDLLRGKKARRPALRDARGKLMLTADGSSAQAVPGATVTLTIDRYIQYVAENAVSKACAENLAKSGTIVVLDVATSEVLALAEWPRYDPNRPETRGKTRNTAITDAFEAGSVMKAFTISGALDTGAVKPTDTFDIEGGRIRIGRKVIRDSYHDDVLDVAGVLKRSSNVGTIKIARHLGADRLYATLVKFGFGRKTGIELPGERSGLIHPTKRWGDIGLAAVSYGYMTMVTPLQIAAGYAAIGNGGLYNEPRIIKEVRQPGGEVLYRHELMPRRVIKKETADIMLPMLAGVFDKGRHGGTARSIEIDGYNAGGKTGTAHKVDPTTHKYGEHLYLSAFAGLAPIEDPRIAVVVLIDEPRGEQYYGARVAGPAFAEVVAGTLRYLGVPTDKKAEPAAHADEGDPPGDEATESADDGVPPELAADAEPGGDTPAAPIVVHPGDGLMPDFRGQTMSQALETARRFRIPIVVEGTGVATGQSPLPGASTLGVEARVTFATH